MTRQNYYKSRSARSKQWVDESLILELVRSERRRQPNAGVRKLHHMISPELESANVSIGRDRLFVLLSRHNLLVKRTRRTTRTTESRHGFRVYPNLAKKLELRAPHQLLVSDITYLRTMSGFMYLALVMDAFSRAIVGYDCSDSLESVGALRALEMALGQLPAGARATHHSDQGIQYCCRPYIERLEESAVSISMTEKNHCYENAKAERLNGTLKNELGLGETFVCAAHAQEAARDAVTIYNAYRPHLSLSYATPMSVHQSEGKTKRTTKAASSSSSNGRRPKGAAR